MKIWMLFGSLTFILMVIIFGYSLSNNIEGNVEFMIFWMLYISTVLTISILASSFFMSLTLKDLKGMPGERGEIGDVGEQGETGECQINCRDKIGYDIIINAIKNRLKENEAMKNGRNPFSAIQRKINDNIRYYDNMNLPSTEIIVKLKEKYKKELNDKTNQENMKEYKKYITTGHINKILNGDDMIDKYDFELNNSYIKEKVKTILDSDEFRDMASYRGPLKLIEYIKDLWVEWVELIYNSSNINYFTSVGAENDFEWVKDNPFNEIKKYDVFNWGLSNKTRPRVVNVKEKYRKKLDIREGFSNQNEQEKEDYTKLVKPEVEGNSKPDNKARLKIIRTNDYYHTYDDAGTTMMEQLRTYRPFAKVHNGEKYFGLGDIVVGPDKTNADNGDKLLFSDNYDKNGKKTFKKKGRIEGPNRDTILVSGDVKKPIGYQMIWEDLQKKLARHWTCKLCKKHPRHSFYRGIAHRPICPNGYISIGDIYTSRDNQTEELKSRTKQDGTYIPIKDNHPVCVPTNCVEMIRDPKPQIIWDTYRSQRPPHRKGSANWFKYVQDNVQIFSFEPSVGNKNFIKATHENSYNLSRMWEESKAVRKKTDSVRAKKDDYLLDDYLRNLEKEEAELEKKENFIPLVYLGLLIKGLEKPLMFRPYMYRIKEKCIVKNNSNINLNGDDEKWPSILKDDKTGHPEEDKTVFFIPENEEDQLINEIPDDIDNEIAHAILGVKKLIKYFRNIIKINKFYKENQYLEETHLNIIIDLNDSILEIIRPVNNEYVYKEKDYSLFYFITEYIGFLSSLPLLSKKEEIKKLYNDIKLQKEEIHRVYREIIDPINEEKLNNLKLKLGLGWKDIPRFDTKNRDYSMHHFFYIDNEGYCKHITNDNSNSITLKFEKIKNPDIYTLKIETNKNIPKLNYYLSLNKGNLNNNLIKKNTLPSLDDKEIINFCFKLKLTGNKTDEIIINPPYQKYNKYVLTYDTRIKIFKFILKKKLKAENEYKFEIIYLE